MSDSLKDILGRMSVFAGQDLGEVYENSRSRTEEIRSSLPKKARRRFDKELRKQTESKSERKRKEAIVNNKKNLKRIEKLEKQLKEHGIENPCPKGIPAHLAKQTRHIIADSTGWAARFYSRICWHKVGVGLTHRGALCYDENDQPLYTYVGQTREAIRARSVLAISLLLLGLSRPTGRKNQGWSRIVKAIPQEAFLSLLADPFTGEARHRNILNGTHRKCADDYMGGSVGYLTALKRAGVIYTRQCKWQPGDNPANQKGWSDILPEEMAGFQHPSGWFTSTVRYWIVADTFLDPVDAEKRARLWLAWLSGCIPWQKDEDGAFVPVTGQDVEIPKRAKPPD